MEMSAGLGPKALFSLVFALLFAFLEPASAQGPQGESLNGDRMYAIVEELAKISGSGLDSGIRMNERAQRAAEFIMRQFQEAGLENVRMESFEMMRWWPVEWKLSISAPEGQKVIPSFPFWYTQGTPGGEIQAELVYVGYGTPGEFGDIDVKGKVVLVAMRRFLHFRESHRFTQAYETAVKKGASAVILGDTLIDSPSGRFLGLPNAIAPIPCLSIGKSSFEHLLNSLSKGKSVKVTLNLKVETGSWKGTNVLGELAGNGEVDEIIVVGGHYDTWFTGANDNCSGVAGLIELARYYSKTPKSSRNRNMIFVALFGHEFRDFGHRHFVDRYKESLDKIALFLDCDHWGAKGYEDFDGVIRETGYPDKQGIFTTNPLLFSLSKALMVKYGLLPAFYWEGEILADMREFHASGIPVFGIGAVHAFYHTPLDTPDKLSPRILEAQASVYRDIIDWVHSTPRRFVISTDKNPKRTPPNEPPREAHFVLLPEAPVVGSPIWVYLGFAYDDHVLLSSDITWDFGDGTTAKGPIAAHAYKSPGVYKVTMTVGDIHGAKAVASKEVQVRAP